MNAIIYEYSSFDAHGKEASKTTAHRINLEQFRGAFNCEDADMVAAIILAASLLREKDKRIGDVRKEKSKDIAAFLESSENPRPPPKVKKWKRRLGDRIAKAHSHDF